MKVITAKPMMLLPPAKGHCQQCAVKHDPAQPHNQQSLYWQFWFTMTYPELERSPTWADAMEHCTPAVREFWTTRLREHGQQFPVNHHPMVKVGDMVHLCFNVKRGRTGRVRNRARMGEPREVISVDKDGRRISVKLGNNAWSPGYTTETWARVVKT